ncbi:hypothetical protein TNCV_2518971 [Trichonephila clavipes]|nr:hypothetical protein TNCV_2518971 [Trichonephila clavipes]
MEDCRLDVHDITSKFGIPVGSEESILPEELNMRKVSSSYDETKRQLSQWKHSDSPHQKKFRVIASAEKVMVPIVVEVVPMCFCLRKPDEDVDTTLLFPNSVTQGVCRNTYDGHRFCALARLISHTHSEKLNSRFS